MMLAVVVAAAMQLQPMVQPQMLSKVKSVTGRATCTSRGFQVIGGVTNVVETWRRGNYTWAVTNVAKNVFGRKQTNTWQERVAEWRRKSEEWEERFRLKAKMADAQVKLLQARREAYVKLRDAALLATTKAIYQKFIDEIDEQLAELDPTVENGDER